MSQIVKDQNVKVTLYWLEKSRSQRILWLLEELGIDYELKTFKRIDMLAPKELKEIHPLGKSPIITVSSNATGSQPVVIAESSNIIEYLIEHFGPVLKPKQWQDGKDGSVGGETESWLRNRYFLHYAEGSLMPLLVMLLIFKTMRDKSPFFIRPLTAAMTNAVESSFISPNLKEHFNMLEEQLKTAPEGGTFLCGPHLTGTDIVLSFPLGAARGRAGLTQAAYPHIWKYLAMLEERACYKKAIQKIIEVEGSYDGSL